MGALKEGVGTVAFSVAFILILRRKVISVLVTRFDNICNNFIRLTRCFTKKNYSQAPIGPEANYNSKTGKPDTTGAGDLGTLRARDLGLGQRT